MNTDFAELAEITARLLNTYPDAPRVSRISLDRAVPDGWTVQAQITRYQDPAATVAALAEWADLLGTRVRLTDQDTHVEVTAVTRVDGRRVRMWGHLVPRWGLELAAAVGTSLVDGPVDVAPALITDALARGVFAAALVAA